MLKNIPTILLLLLLGCAASKVKSVQTDLNTTTIRFRENPTETTNAAPLKYRVLVGGLWTVLTGFWGSFAYTCYGYLTSKTSTFPKTLFLGLTDILFVVLGNLLLAVCWAALLSILVGREEDFRQLFHKNPVEPSKVVPAETPDDLQQSEIALNKFNNSNQINDDNLPEVRSPYGPQKPPLIFSERDAEFGI